jgi:flagellar hook-length control protein FliK
VNATSPISGTVNAHANAHGASHAQSTNSSLADFLLPDSTSNGHQDFRAIAAGFFGAESSTTIQTQPPGKDSIAGKKNAPGVSEAKPDDKTKVSPDPAFAANQLTIALPNVPIPLVEVAPKQEAIGGTAGKPDISSQQSKGLAILADLAMTKSNLQLATDATPREQAAPLTTPSTTTPLSSPKELDMKDATGIKDDVGIKPPTGPADSTPSIQPPGIADAENLKFAKESMVRAGSPSANGTLAKKAVGDRAQAQVSPDAAKPDSAKTVSPQSATTRDATSPVDAHVSANPNQQTPLIPNSAPLPQTPEPKPVTSSAETLDSSISAKPVPQPGPVNPNLAAESKSASGRTAPGASAKSKDKNSKDSRTVTSPNSRPGFVAPGPVTGGAANPGASSIKDATGLSLATHSGAHAGPTLSKQSAGTTTSPAALGETDAPDESLPTSEPASVTAKLVQGMSQSEFRVGMQSQEFGNIDIRTSVARHMFSAQISVERGDVAKSMTADLPALYHRLADQQVPVASIVIQGQNLATSSGLSQDAQSRNWQPQGQGGTRSNAEPFLPMVSEALDSTGRTFDSAGRLDIRI